MNKDNYLVTTDFSKFGYRELKEAATLLDIVAEHGKPEFLEDGLTVNFNVNSGNVFISDEDYNVGVLAEGKIVQFYNCFECGYEGTQDEAEEDGKDFVGNNGYCSAECKSKNA